MLTLKSKFSEFIELCRKAGACSDKGEAIPVMESANKGEGMKADGTCADGFKLYLSDEKMPEEWASWVLDKVGKELDEDCRKFFIDKIKNEMVACQVYIKCAPILTTTEDTLLTAKFEGKLPTAEKELRDGIVTRATAEVAP